MKGDPTSLLRAQGLHVTAQRLAVLRAVERCPHGAAEAIAEAVRTDIGAISRQAVYDSLALLSEKGLIRRIQPAGSPALFDPRIGDGHHHLICRSCAAVVDVDCATASAPCLRAPADTGYEIDAAEVLYWGVCPACRAGDSALPPTLPIPANPKQFP
jgi:Fur family ferric uptake transcriptional regulator